MASGRKLFWKSKTFWGVLMALPSVASTIAAAVGHPEIGIAIETLWRITGEVDWAAILGAPGLGLAMLGRWQARQPLTVAPSLEAKPPT